MSFFTKRYSASNVKTSLILCLLFAPLQVISQEQVSVTEVMVWVKVQDRSGKAITGLYRSDFEIYEDGKKVEPTCFEETVHAPASGTTAPQTDQTQTVETAPARMKRVTMILDLYNTQQSEYLFIRPKIIDFLKQIPSGWEIMLATVIPGAMEINVPFTNDSKVLETKLDQITANARRDIDVLNRRRSILNLLDRGSFAKIIEEAYRLAQEYASDEKQMARESIKAFEKFEKDLVGFKNNSHMVALYISGGINSEPGRQYFDIIERKLGNSDFARSSIFAQREGSSDLWGMLRKIVAQLNRHSITFYTINTRGIISPIPDSATERNREARFEDTAYLDDTQELMAEIADETGGLYFENSSNFRKGFDLILDDLDHQYLLCYKAPAHKKQNEFHKIKVTSRKSGTKLRHRTGYID